MRLIDGDVLYERTAEWEAQALHMVFVTMHDEDLTEWRKWSTILTERSAFMHDVADAPTIEPSAQPERLSDDDFETIRIHLSAHKEKLCNQGRWKEAEEYQRIIDRFMAFALEENHATN